MNDKRNQQSKKEETPAVDTGAAAVQSSGWKKLLAKKWVFPATYMAAAAIILTLMWVYQGTGKLAIDESEVGLDLTGKNGTAIMDQVTQPPDALPVTALNESMVWPVREKESLQVIKPFYEKDAPSEVRQAAMVEYKDEMIPHVGIDLALEVDEPFEVLAALSGLVTRVAHDPLVGHLVEITHDNKLVTIYQSLTDVIVTKGNQVEQGQVIALAGRNELEKDLGIHLHFEVRDGEGGQPINPAQFLPEQD